MPLPEPNAFGNIDTRQPLPSDCVHAQLKRLQPLCRHLDIPYLEAFTGFNQRGRRFSPIIFGVVIEKKFEKKLLDHVKIKDIEKMKKTQLMQEKVIKKTKIALLGPYKFTGEGLELKEGWLNNEVPGTVVADWLEESGVDLKIMRRLRLAMRKL